MKPSERLRKFMELNKLTQQNVADKFGINKSNIGNYLTQRIKIPKPFAFALKSEFGLSPEWLLNGKGDMYIFSKDKREKIIFLLSKYPELIPIIEKITQGGGIMLDISHSISNIPESHRETVKKMLKGLMEEKP